MSANAEDIRELKETKESLQVVKGGEAKLRCKGCGCVPDMVWKVWVSMREVIERPRDRALQVPSHTESECSPRTESHRRDQSYWSPTCCREPGGHKKGRGCESKPCEHGLFLRTPPLSLACCACNVPAPHVGRQGNGLRSPNSSATHPALT